MRAVLLLLAVSLGAQTLSERGVTLARQQVDEFRQEPRVAVIVAVDQYQEESGFRKLEYATKDASALAAALQAADFSYNVRTLLNERARRTVIRTAIRNAAQVAGSKGTLLFFFAGHGGQKDGKQYLATYEAGADNLSELGLPISEVRDLMNQSNAARKILIVDACRNDPTAKASRSASDDTLLRFGRLEESEGLRILNATAPNQVSYEDPKFGHGVFTHFLLEGLGGKATDPYGMITFRSLSDYVSREVRDYSYPIGRLQIPYEAGSGFGDFLVGGKLGPPQIVKPAPAPAGPVPTDPAREAWERAKSSTNKAGALQAIVREFPNSDYARLARVDLAGMGAAPGEALFNEALKLFDQGEIPLAGAVFDSVLRAQPGNLAAAGYRALLLAFDRAGREAIAAAGLVLSKQPGNITARLARGDAWNDLNQAAKARPDLEKVAGSTGPDARDSLMRGMAYLDLGDSEKAVREFSEALRLVPNFPRALANRASAYTNLRKYDEAIRDYTEAIRLQPAYAAAFCNRGRMFDVQGRFDQALRDYNEALRLRPNYPDALNLRGFLSFRQKKYDQAIRDYNEALRLNPTYVWALNNRADAKEALGDRAGAAADRAAVQEMTRQ